MISCTTRYDFERTKGKIECDRLDALVFTIAGFWQINCFHLIRITSSAMLRCSERIYIPVVEAWVSSNSL